MVPARPRRVRSDRTPLTAEKPAERAILEHPEVYPSDLAAADVEVRDRRPLGIREPVRVVADSHALVSYLLDDNGTRLSPTVSAALAGKAGGFGGQRSRHGTGFKQVFAT
jgi:hypothetical protein